MADHLTSHAAARAIAADARLDGLGQTVMAAAPDLTADIDRWNIEAMVLLNRIRNLRLGPMGRCAQDLAWIVAAAGHCADDRRRIEAVLAALAIEAGKGEVA